MNLCIGTAQLGMDYGIAGGKKPENAEAVAILGHAITRGIRTIDTAEIYGDSENIVGQVIRQNIIPRKDLFIVSKVAGGILDDVPADKYIDRLSNRLDNSLDRMKTNYVDAYLFHTAEYVNEPEMLRALSAIKETGRVRKTGVSVYEVDEARKCVSSPYTDFMQIPFSVLDQRMKWSGLLDNNGSTEIHARSPFTQGAIFLHEDMFPKRLNQLGKLVQMYQSICHDRRCNPMTAAIQYIKSQTGISSIVFGTYSIQQLDEIIEAYHTTVPEGIFGVFDEMFKSIPKEVILPNYWNRKDLV